MILFKLTEIECNYQKIVVLQPYFEFIQNLIN